MSEHLRAVLTKVERSKKHMVELEAEVNGFLATNPYVVGTRRNPETRQLIYYVTGVRETPVSLALIAGDVLQNLRSALDHLAHQLIANGTRHPGPFPYDRRRRRRLRSQEGWTDQGNAPYGAYTSST